MGDQLYCYDWNDERQTQVRISSDGVKWGEPQDCAEGYEAPRGTLGAGPPAEPHGEGELGVLFACCGAEATVAFPSLIHSALNS